MRVEPFTVDSYIHVVKRGARGLPIVIDDADQWRFLRLMYYMNDEYLDENWDQVTKSGDLFNRPDWWPERLPIVRILGFTLMSNHLHLILQEMREGGVSMFMRKLGQSMTNHHNEKYRQRGSLFQGSYRARTIQSDEYLRYVAVYVMVKNIFELYPMGGLEGAIKNFEAAWSWAVTYPFSSLGEYASERNFPIIDKGIFGEIYATSKDFKRFAHEVIKGGKWLNTDFE